MLSLIALCLITEVLQCQRIRIRLHITLVYREASIVNRNLITLRFPLILRAVRVQVHIADLYSLYSETLTVRTIRSRSLYRLGRANRQNRSVLPCLIRSPAGRFSYEEIHTSRDSLISVTQTSLIIHCQRISQIVSIQLTGEQILLYRLARTKRETITVIQGIQLSRIR